MRRLTKRDGSRFIHAIMYYAIWSALMAIALGGVVIGLFLMDASILIFTIPLFGFSLYQNIKFYKKVAEYYSDLCNTGVYDG